VETSTLFDPAAAQENLLDAVKKSQNATVDAVKTIVDLFRPITDRLPQLPFADSLPQPGANIDAGFAFAEELLAAQRAFAKELAEVLTPAVSAEG
jgi:hypothetical protein